MSGDGRRARHPLAAVVSPGGHALAQGLHLTNIGLDTVCALTKKRLDARRSRFGGRLRGNFKGRRCLGRRDCRLLLLRPYLRLVDSPRLTSYRLPFMLLLLRELLLDRKFGKRALPALLRLLLYLRLYHRSDSVHAVRL